jgi:predicted small secreted protein
MTSRLTRRYARPVLILLAACSTLAAACATGGAAGRSVRSAAPADSTSAHRAAVGFLAAFDSLQWEPFRAYLADDMTMFFPFPQFPWRADGRAAVESVFGQFMTAQREARGRAGRPMVQGIAPRDLRVQMLGADAAIVSFHLGQETPARRSIVLRRTAADRWQVAHWHASAAPQDPRR